MKLLMSLIVLLSATLAFAWDDEQQKQNDAEKAFKSMTTAEALASSDIYAQYPWLYFPAANKKSLMHDDCFTGDVLLGGGYRKCIDFNTSVNECLEWTIAPLTMPASEAPTSVKVRFYREVVGSSDQTSSEYYLGTREVAVPNCK